VSYRARSQATCYDLVVTSNARSHVDDLRGASRLAIEATRGITDLVEEMHVTIASGPAVLGQPLAAPARAITGVVYGAIRGVTGLVGGGIDGALARLAPLVGASPPGPEREALLAALNGVLGDYLEETGNPLAIRMHARHGGRALELSPEALRRGVPGAGPRVLVLVHGSCMTDGQFTRRGHDHGAALARDLGYTPVYLRYNSGLHVSTNGRAFAGLLEQLVAAWPVPVAELVILGHSMGGLVARSACHYGADHAWMRRLRALVTLGTPHHGAPMERGGNLIDAMLDVSRYSAPLGRLGRIRSAGVTDLRYGNTLDEHWQGRDRFARGADTRCPVALPAGARCYAVAGTLSPAPGGALRSDGMVPVDSALGAHVTPQLTLGFSDARKYVAYGAGHLDLLDAPDVYAAIRGWLSEPELRTP
jgi:hypothetical protein